MRLFRTAPLVLLSTIVFLSAAPAATVGYYRQPTLCKDGILFVAEGDLWKVGDKGGEATRLTSDVGDESLPAVSPDGKLGGTLAFVAQYDGPTEVYTMPLAGGVPRRRTFDGAEISFVGWTPDGKVLVGTDADSTLPQTQLVTLDISQKTVPCARSSPSPRPPTAPTTKPARRSSSRACRSRAATPSATRAAPPRTSGSTPTATPRRRRSPPIIPAPARTPWSGRAAFISSPTATAP